MKSKRISYAVILALIAGIALHSCHKEESSAPLSQQGQRMLKSVPLPDCQTTYLQNGPYIQETTSDTVQWGPLSAFPGYYRNNKYFIATAWNDDGFFYIQADVFGYQYNQTGGKVKVLTGPSNNNYPFTDVIITLNGVTYNYSMDDPATPDIIETAITYTQAYPLPADWERCDEMVYTVRLEGDGHPVMLGTISEPEYVTYGLYDYSVCETVMTGTTECGNIEQLEGDIITEVWTFISGGVEYSIEGEHYLTIAYTPDVSGYAVLQGNLSNLTQMAFQGGDLACDSDPSDPDFTQVFADYVEACQTYTIHVIWYSGTIEGDITGAWTADVYENETMGTSLSHMDLDPLQCDETLAGY